LILIYFSIFRGFIEKFNILFFGLICLAGVLLTSYILIKFLYLKLVCTKSVEATVTDIYNTKAMNGYVYGPNVLEERMGTKIIIKIDENNPSNIYSNLGWQAFLFIMLFVLCLTLLVVMLFYI